MDHRSYGETRDCKGCRFWSEMIARAQGGGPVEAVCLSGTGSRAGQYTTGRNTCEAWESGHLGAIDEPGTDGTQYEGEG
jgi:hypothetical protein